jgi:hypothetical protein
LNCQSSIRRSQIPNRHVPIGNLPSTIANAD